MLTMSTTTAPNSPVIASITDNSNSFYNISSSNQCDTIATGHGISIAQLKRWNSEINNDCSNLWLNYYVCVHLPGATTTTQGPPQPTDEPSGPTPKMLRIVDNCKTFYLIKHGDSCWSIYTNVGITFERFRSWNKEVDADCTNLWHSSRINLILYRS